MDIQFCDLCNESIPAPDLAAGKTFKHKGRLICAQCNVAMGGSQGRAARPQSGMPAPAQAPMTPSAQPMMAGPAVMAPGPSRAWPGVAGLLVGTAALVAVGVGGGLMLERLDAVQGDADSARAETLQAKAVLRAERRAAIEPLRGEIRDSAERSGTALVAAVDAQSQRIGQLERQLEAAGVRESELRASLEGVRGLLADAKRELEARRADDLAVVARLDKVVEFHGNRLIELEERIREAGALVAAGVVPPGMAGTPGDSGGPPVWEPLVAELGSEDAAVRLQAAYDLGETGDPEVVPHLLPMLQDTDVFVRMVTAQAFDTLGSKLAVPNLIDRLEDDTITVREAALIALRNITGERFGYEPDARQADRKKKIDQWRSWWRREGDDFLAS